MKFEYFHLLIYTRPLHKSLHNSLHHLLKSIYTRGTMQNTITDLIPYHTEYAVPAGGLKNYGNTCHFNSMIQAILSCTAVFEKLEALAAAEDPSFEENVACQFLLDIYHKMKDKKENINRSIFNLWQYLLERASGRRDRVTWTAAQQDAHESFLLLMDGIESCHEILNLFRHRYRRALYCAACRRWSESREILNTVFDIPPSLQNQQLPQFANLDCYFNKPMPMNAFIKGNNDYVDKDYICGHADCKVRGEQFQSTILTMVPEILPIIFKKYERKQMTRFPKELIFEAKNTTCTTVAKNTVCTTVAKNTNATGTESIADRKIPALIYKLVAQVEHSGSQQGGHYWAVCLRSDGKFYELNDSSVSEEAPGPTLNTYMVIYEFDREEQVEPFGVLPSTAVKRVTFLDEPN